MTSSLKRLSGVAGITCALVGSGPVALAAAASPPASSGTPLFPGLSCSVNQGLPPGFLNLGPTGPLGPLGPNGPLGGGNSNLPCGLAAFNLGPTGPLGPGGPLATVQPPASTSQPAPAQPSGSTGSKATPSHHTRTHKTGKHHRSSGSGKHHRSGHTPQRHHPHR